MTDPLSMLTSQEAGETLAAAVGSAGGEVVAWSHSGVHHRPGSSTTASYRAQVRWGDQVVEETPSPVSPPSPSPVSPPSPVSVDSPSTPDSPAPSVQSAPPVDSPASPVSVDTPESPDSPASAD